MTKLSFFTLAIMGLLSSPAIADNAATPSGSSVFTLTQDVKGCLKPFAIEPTEAQCRTIPKGTRVNPKERTRSGFILTCIADGREPQCLLITSEELLSALPH